MNQLSGSKFPEAFTELEQYIFGALETYSNVHRGSGHNSMATTRLFEQARGAVLEYLGLKKGGYAVIFSSPRRALKIIGKLRVGTFKSLSSNDIGLPFGVTALAIKKNALPHGAPSEAGGGTTRLISRDWIIWDKAPEKFEPGTPAVINVIAFAKALQLAGLYGTDVFSKTAEEISSTGNLMPGDETGATDRMRAANEILYPGGPNGHSGRTLLEELKKNLIGRDLMIPVKEGTKPFINLDYAASTPTFMPVWEAVRQTWLQPPAVQEAIIREVRSICSGFLGAPSSDYDLIFTSNTTEAINLAAESFARQYSPEGEPVVLNTLLEHNSNDLPWRLIPGCSLLRLKVDPEGFIDLREMESLLIEYNREKLRGNSRIRLVAMSGASNVLGTFNDLEEISRIVHRHGAHLLVDAAQLVAHRSIDMEKSGIDYLAFSAHKAYAPFGTGVLAVRKGLLNFSDPEMAGIRSSGEENICGIAALGKALLLLQRIGFDVIREEEQALTAQALQGLARVDGLTVYGIKDPATSGFTSKGGVIVFGFKNLMANVVARELAELGFGVRYGCHCAHILVKYILGVSPGLEKFQRVMLTLIPSIRLPGLTRISLGIGTTEEDVDTFVECVSRIASKHRAAGR
jgi:selenocysteine lyase/cysteine desulfurase